MSAQDLDTPESNCGSVWPWFFAFLIAMAAGTLAAALELVPRPWAIGLIFAPMLLLVPMVRNAMRQARAKGGVGEAQRRYLARMALVSLLYVASVGLASFLIDEGDPISPVSIAISILPGVGVVGFFWTIGRYILETQDEFLRMLIVRQALIATAFALSVASVWGFLEQYEQVPYVPSYWVAILWFFGLGIGAAVNKLTYGTFGEAM